MSSNPSRVSGAALTWVLLSSVWAAAPAGTSVPHYVVDPTWPRKPEHIRWEQMPGITVDLRDQIYIFNRSEPAVQVYQADGTYLRAWNIEDAGGAHYIRIDGEGKRLDGGHQQSCRLQAQPRRQAVVDAR